MKRFTRLSALVLGVAALFATLMPQQASAKGGGNGEMTVGVNAGLATYNSGGYMNLAFQYTFVPHVRIAPEIGYVFRNENKSAFIMSVDMHFPFRVAKGFALYPLAGLTFNNWNYRDDGSAARVGGDIGAGMEVYLTNYLKIMLQGKYSIMDDTSGGFIGLGIGYVF